MKAELFLARQDILGEGILVQNDLNRICWIDILGKQLLIADLDGTNTQAFQQDSEIGAVLPSADTSLILVLRNTVVEFEPTAGTTRELWSAEALEPTSNRFNDAAIDPFGNLWIGSMDFDAAAPTGKLYRLRPDGQFDIVDQGYACLNGPAFSGDGKTVYVGDTMAGQVLAYTCDPATRATTDKRIFHTFGQFDGLPDGMAVYAADNLWVCQITAGRISCFAPDGTKLKSIALPVPMVTSCCFGGVEMSALFVTTARIILDQSDLEAFPQSGSLYRVDTNHFGRAPYRFGIAQKENQHE